MLSFRARFATASTALFVLSNLLCAAPALTTIQDVLYKADGTRFNGILQIRWNSFQAADATNIAAQTVTTQVSNGYLHVLLVPTTNANPAAVYTVVYNSDGNIQFTETWVVPPSSGPLRVADVRSTAFVGSAGGAATLGIMQIGDISGLRTELNIRPTMGAGFATSRAAIIDGTGGISSALGNLSDCVHTDGSSGPCGGSGGGGSVAGPSTSGFVDAESPSGIVDGANTIFQLANAPNPAGSLTLFRNGLALQRNTEFTVSASTVTFLAGSVPQAGDILQAFYRTLVSGPSAVCVLYTLAANGTAWTASTTQDITLFALPAKGIVTGVREKTIAAWNGSGFTTLSLSIGDSVGGPTFYTAAGYDLTAPAGNTNFRNTQLFKSSTDAGSNVIAHITANAPLNSATITGTINIDVCSVVLP